MGPRGTRNCEDSLLLKSKKAYGDQIFSFQLAITRPRVVRFRLNLADFDHVTADKQTFKVTGSKIKVNE